MAALDPFDMLVRLGKITQAQLEAADLVASAVGMSTRAARLVAIGVDKEKLLDALSELTRMPVATPELLAAAGPMALPSAYSALMKDMLAVPIGRIDEHILEVAIADPRTTTKLRDAAIAHRPRIALEADVIEALARVFPNPEVLDPFREPTLKEIVLSPRPVSVEGARVDDDLAEHVAPTAPPPVELVDASAGAARDVPRPESDDDLPLIAGDALSDAVPAASQPSPDQVAPRTTHTEVTERVRDVRPRAEDVVVVAPHPLFERIRQLGPRTLAVAAAIAVVVAIAVLALVASPRDAPVDVDAGVATNAPDAGEEAPTVATPTPAPIEKPAKKPSKTTHKPVHRPQKKRR